MLAIKEYYEHYKSPSFLSLDNTLFNHTLAGEFSIKRSPYLRRKTHEMGDYLQNQAAGGKF